MDPYLEQNANLNRLINDYKKHGSLTIGFDFEDTVYDFHKKGYTYDNVIHLLRQMKKLGFTLICWTANKDLQFVSKYLNENNIPFDGINTNGIDLGWESRKPFFSALLDDRAGLIQVYNELSTLVSLIENGG